MSLFALIPEIMEVTLRDGSYLIDFQFTAEDTSILAAALESAGIRWIEVGHGMGLNASGSGHGQAAATDEEYLEAASHSLQQARWGMFFIPGIGREDDLRLAARYRMSFVRIGTNITEVDEAERYFRLAKELGLIVTWNGMKSYAVKASEFGRKTALVRAWGADAAYLVDSAGGMFPDDVTAYLKAARDASDIALGFHGHDNLTLAMANTLRAIECGAVLLDSSLQGMGRSAGNAVTEALVAILKQRGGLLDVDMNAIMDIGQGLIPPLMRRRGLDPMAVTAGHARFHSSFTPKVERYAQKYDVDARDLIVRLCQEDQLTAPDALLDQLSRELAVQRMPRLIAVRAFHRGLPKPEQGAEAVALMLKEMRALAVKTSKFSALNIVIGSSPMEHLRVSANIQSGQVHVIGSVALTSEAQLKAALAAADGLTDVIFLDIDKKEFAAPDTARIARCLLAKSLLLTYSDSRIWIEAVEEQAVRLLEDDLADVPIVIAGDHPYGRLLARHLTERRAAVSLQAEAESAETAALGEARMVIVWPRGAPTFGSVAVRRLRPGAWLMDAGIGAIQAEGIAEAHARGIRPIRVNIWPVLAGHLLAAFESAQVCRNSMGWSELGGIPVVAGGALGRRDDVIVDSIREPTRVVGVADGKGGVIFRYSAEQTERVGKVTEAIHQRLVAPRSRGME